LPDAKPRRTRIALARSLPTKAGAQARGILSYFIMHPGIKGTFAYRTLVYWITKCALSGLEGKVRLL